MQDHLGELSPNKFHPPSPPPSSATYQRQRQTIAERMRMSHVVQAQRTTWPAGSWRKT
jgi:hypothetical protein